MANIIPGDSQYRFGNADYRHANQVNARRNATIEADSARCAAMAKAFAPAAPLKSFQPSTSAYTSASIVPYTPPALSAAPGRSYTRGGNAGGMARPVPAYTASYTARSESTSGGGALRIVAAIGLGLIAVYYHGHNEQQIRVAAHAPRSAHVQPATEITADHVLSIARHFLQRARVIANTDLTTLFHR